ncbi:MAG TPA: hypothetical protein VFP91_09650 [Vicinamibacterales bacterium]|nr:hypothetical protein [Vicinamibacterales bacterium]
MSTKRRISILAITIAAAVLALGVTVARAAGSEQIVFSGTGFPPVSSEPWGFWVWCQNEQADPSVGHSKYETDCNGALYFYQRGVVVHVTGEVSEDEDVEGTYIMDLESVDGSVVCTLTNTPPILHGPHNTVSASDCTVNGESVSGLVSTNAVVNATGP